MKKIVIAVAIAAVALFAVPAYGIEKVMGAKGKVIGYLFSNEEAQQLSQELGQLITQYNETAKENAMLKEALTKAMKPKVCS